MPLRVIKELLDREADPERAPPADRASRPPARAARGPASRSGSAPPRCAAATTCPRRCSDRLAELDVLAPADEGGYSPTRRLASSPRSARFRAGGYDERIGFTVYESPLPRAARGARRARKMLSEKLVDPLETPTAWSSWSRRASGRSATDRGDARQGHGPRDRAAPLPARRRRRRRGRSLTRERALDLGARAAAALTVVGAIGTLLASGPYLSTSEGIEAWLLVYALGVFGLLLFAPFALHRRIASSEKDRDRRWEARPSSPGEGWRSPPPCSSA